MIPIDQTTFGIPEGNCFSACVASLLHLPIAEVPNFCKAGYENPDRQGPDDWPRNFIRWLQARGFFPVFAKGTPPYEFYGNFFWIAGGTSPRGPHAVVMYGDRMVHDPHPSRVGIEEVEDWTILVPVDPGKVLDNAERATRRNYISPEQFTDFDPKSLER
jgi:hypothetical protein